MIVGCWKYSTTFVTVGSLYAIRLPSLDVQKGNDRKPGKNSKLGCGRDTGVLNKEGPWMTSHNDVGGLDDDDDDDDDADNVLLQLNDINVDDLSTKLLPMLRNKY
jgi:hypothetical protein